MKKKSVLWGVGIVITVISIMATLSFKISKLSDTENMDLWKRTRVVKQKSEDLANNAKAQFFWRTAQQDIEDILDKATRPDDSKEKFVQFGSQEKAEKQAAAYLLSHRITEYQIEYMKSLGYSAKEVAAIWKVCSGPEERSFLLHMMKGTKESYKKAFQIDPNKLSDSITVFLGEHSMRLIGINENGTFIQETNEQFEHFNNAVLSSEKKYYCKGEDGRLAKTEFLYRDIYLQRMYLSSIVEMEKRVLELSLLNQEETIYAERYAAYVKDMYVLNLWGSEGLVAEKIGGVRGGETYQLSIQDLTYMQNMGFSLNMTHYSPSKKVFVSEKVSNDILWKSASIDNKWSTMGLKAMAKEKVVVKKAVATGIILTVGIMVVLMCFAWCRKKRRENRRSSSGINRSEKSKKPQNRKFILRRGIILVSIIIAATCCWKIVQMSRKMEYLHKENIDKENWQKKMVWFGMAGGYDISGSGMLEEETGVIFANIYSPTVLRGIHVWEQSGIAGWLGWDETTVNEIKTKMEKDYSDEIQVRIEKLLNGNRSAEENIGVIGMTNMDQFEDDIELIESVYKQIPETGQGEEGSLNIKYEWRRYMSGKYKYAYLTEE